MIIGQCSFFTQRRKTGDVNEEDFKRGEDDILNGSGCSIFLCWTQANYNTLWCLQNYSEVKPQIVRTIVFGVFYLCTLKEGSWDLLRRIVLSTA